MIELQKTAGFLDFVHCLLSQIEKSVSETGAISILKRNDVFSNWEQLILFFLDLSVPYGFTWGRELIKLPKFCALLWIRDAGKSTEACKS
jgi:hypothetical protein